MTNALLAEHSQLNAFGNSCRAFPINAGRAFERTQIR